MMAPSTGPHIRSHSIGGPAWRIVPVPEPERHAGRLDVDEHRLGGEEAIDGRGIGRRDPPADRIVRVVLEAGEEQADVAVALGRRAPVEAGDRRPVGGERLGEHVEADVHGAHAVGEEHRRSGRRSSVTSGRDRRRAQTIRAASAAARALLGARRTPASASRASWATRSCGSPLGAAHRRDDGEPAAVAAGVRPGRVDRAGRARRRGRRGRRSRGRRRAG